MRIASENSAPSAIACAGDGHASTSHRSHATSASATAPNDAACVIDGSMTTYHASGVASRRSMEVTSAMTPPTSLRIRRWRAVSPAAAMRNDPRYAARMYGVVSPRATPSARAQRPAAPPNQSTAATIT